MQDGIFIKNCEAMSLKLFDVMEMDFDESTEFDRQMLAMFSFGMISAMAEENQILLDTKYFEVENVIMEDFKYSKQTSIDIRKKLVDSIQKGGNEVFQIMINQGKRLYPEYKKNNYNEVYDKLTNLIDVIVTGEYKNY